MVGTTPPLPVDLSDTELSQIRVVLSDEITEATIGRLLMVFDGVVCNLWYNKTEGLFSFDSINTGNLLMYNPDFPESDFNLNVMGHPQESLTAIRWLRNETLLPLVGKVIPYMQTGIGPQYLAVGEKCAVLINGFYFVYHRLSDRYEMSVLIDERSGNALCAPFDDTDNNEQMAITISAADRYFVPVEDALDPAGWVPFPVPLPDHVEWTSEYVGIPICAAEF